ncbi:MAG: DUF1232 domain-containing protein [Sumerlaeia bacterium]
MIKPDNVRPEDEQKVHDKLDQKLQGLGGDQTGAKAARFVRRMMRDVRTLYDMMRDPGFALEWKDKAVIIASLLYFIAPIDVIPDFIIGVGYIDDAVVLGMAMKTLNDVLKRFRVYRGESDEDVIEGKAADS